MKIGVYTVTPENQVCFKCKKKKCKGDCKDFREYLKTEQAKRTTRKRNPVKP